MSELEEPQPGAPVTSTAAVTAAERRREQDRARKQRQRDRERDQAATHVEQKGGGQPKRDPAPERDSPPRSNPFAGVRSAAGSWAKKMAEPVGPTEARRQLWHIHMGFARILRSTADLAEDDFNEAGQAFEEMANHWPGFEYLRLALRLGAPLILIGALWMIWARILRETPWVQRWRARAAREEVIDHPAVVAKDPLGGADARPAGDQAGAADAPDEPAVERPPLPNLYRLRGR